MQVKELLQEVLKEREEDAKEAVKEVLHEKVSELERAKAVAAELQEQLDALLEKNVADVVAD